MLKLFVCCVNTSLRTLFILFNVLDLALYAVGILKCSFIIYEGRQGEANLPGLSASECIAFGLVAVGFMVVLSAWSCVQLARFVQKQTVIEANQKYYFILKIVLGVGLVIVPLILMEIVSASIVFTLVCVAINILQITWAVQIYIYINQELQKKKRSGIKDEHIVVNSESGFQDMENEPAFPEKTV